MKFVSLVDLALVALAGLGFTSSTADAWTITSANATQASDFVGKHQEFVKVWTVQGSAPVGAIEIAAAGPVFIEYGAPVDTPIPTTEAPPNPEPLPTTQAPATTPPSSGSSVASLTSSVVSFTVDDEKVVAQIFVRGNCTSLLDEIDVLERQGAIQIQFKNNDFHGFGYLLMQVVVTEKATLATISTSGSSSVYIGEDVVVSDSSSSVEIAVRGSADVYVSANATAFTLESLALKIQGTGTIQFHAASLTVHDTLSSTFSGDGTIAVVAPSITVGNTLQSTLNGQGDMYIQSDNLTAVHIDSKLSGQGSITLSTSGTCGSQDISLSGQGSVAAGSILCEDTTLKLTGWGSVLVQTSGTFLVPHRIDGKVQYWGNAPQRITDGSAPRTHPPRQPHGRQDSHPPHDPHEPHSPRHHSWFWGWWDHDSDGDSASESDIDSVDEVYGFSERGNPHLLPHSVTAATANTFRTYVVRALPARVATFLILTTRQNRHSAAPKKDVVFTHTGSDIDSSDSAGLKVLGSVDVAAWRFHEQDGTAGTAALGLFAMAVVAAVGVAVHKVVLQRRRRSEYQPLLQVVTN